MTTSPASTTDQPEGESPPTFDSLALSADVLRAIDEMGYALPTPVQIAAYGPTVDGKDLIVQAQTGTGKTAAFGLPLVDRMVRSDGGAQVLILAPTRELSLQSAKEIGRIAKYRDLRCVAVYGGAPMDRQVRELQGGAQIISGTPGRVLDHLRRGTLDASAIKVLVLDEADEMLSMGFAKELNAIIDLLPRERQTLLFSATVDTAIQRVAQRHMQEPEFISLSSDQIGAQGVSHFIYMLSGKARINDLIRIIEIEDPESAIVFCNLKAETEQVAERLCQAGFQAEWLNGDLPQSERERVMDRTRRGDVRYLVATDVAARGIDVSHVTHVINFSFPESVEQYIHRTGRTGRAGRTGTAVSLIGPQDLGSLYYLRLQYKIFPVERSLPTKREEQTRRETDRLAMLEQALTDPPGDADRALAQRLLSHPDAEHLIAGLMRMFFGGRSEDADEEAAAARRARPPRPALAKAGRGDDGPPSDPPPRSDSGRSRPPRERSSDRSARPRRAAGAEPREGAAFNAERAAPDTERPTPSNHAPEEEMVTLIYQPQDHGEAPNVPPAGARSRNRAGEDGPRSEPSGRRTRRVSEEPVAEPADGSSAKLYINLGRRDGVRPGDINRLLTDRCDVPRDDIGRIRIRDRHTYVEVPDDQADGVIEALHGKEAHDRELVVERARSQE